MAEAAQVLQGAHEQVQGGQQVGLAGEDVLRETIRLANLTYTGVLAVGYSQMHPENERRMSSVGWDGGRWGGGRTYLSLAFVI